MVFIKDPTSDEMLVHGTLPQGLISVPSFGSIIFSSPSPLGISVYESILRTVAYSNDGERYLFTYSSSI